MRNEGAGSVQTVPRLAIDIRHIVRWLNRLARPQPTPNGGGRAVKRVACWFSSRIGGP
jgi:hypothetical protein